MRDDDDARLTGLIAQLEQQGYETTGLKCREMRDQAQDGVLPAHQRRGIWHYYPQDLERIAVALRLRRAKVAIDT